MAQSVENDPRLSGFSIQEIAYGMWHEGFGTQGNVVGVARYLQDGRGFNNANIRGYLNATYHEGGVVLSGPVYGMGQNMCYVPGNVLLMCPTNGEPVKPSWLEPFNNAKKLISPIVLDLDGDGIETKDLQNGVFFDHDANGFAQQSGWVRPDDGLLAWDRNNDGQINDGRELFGSGTLLRNGSNAANGFAALDDLDNNRDGKIDAHDAAWASLRVWKDTNGDAHTDAGELLSLADAGIQSVGTSYKNSTAIDAQGNEHRQVGSYTRTDGSTATATDVWFDENAAISHANEEVAVSADIAALPDAAGYGIVYSLHQAMARDSSGALKTLVQSFVAETDPDARRGLVEQILLKWTGSEGISPQSRGGYIDGGKLTVLETFAGQTWSYNWGGAWYPGQVGPSAAAALTSAYDNLVEQVYGQLVAQSHLQDLWSRITLRWDEPTQSLKADLSAVVTELQSRLTADPLAGKALLGEFARSVHALQAEQLLNFPAFREVFAAQGADRAWALDSGGKTVMTGTAGNDTLFGASAGDAIQGGAGSDTVSGSGGNDVVYGDEGDDILAGGFGNDILDGGAGNDTLNGGGGDVVWWATNGNDTYLFGRGSGQDTITDYDTTAAGDVDTIVFKPGISPGDISINRSGNDLVLSINDTSDQLTVKDYFYGETNLYTVSWLSTKELNPYKIEKIKFADGTVWNYEDLMSETINGTGGAGSLYGYDGNDQLNGLDGNDDLHGGWGDDVLDGGAGNDTLDGGTGNDVYVFARGSGQDVINDNDAAQGNIDTVEFGADIIPADVHVTHDTQNVYLTIDGSMDRVKLSNWLTSDAYKIEQVKFADGTVWNRTTLFAMAMQPSDGGDRLFGDGEDNVLSGLGGDDTLYGQDGNDTLMGGADNDTLHGGTGTDTLDGGSGIDTMDGGAGSDAYVFHRGYGRDGIRLGCER
ncbi:MAG: calcium-binding protein [Gammaproteobacteria bacterium]